MADPKGIRDTDKGWGALFKRISEMPRARVRVGVLEEGKGGAEHDEGGYTNAQIAAVHEFGTEDGVIPERSFIRSTFDKEREHLIELSSKLVVNITEGKMKVLQAMNILGADLAAKIKKNVTEGPGIPPPLKQATIDSKGSDRPLVDTGRMVNSVSWVASLEGGARGGASNADGGEGEGE